MGRGEQVNEPTGRTTTPYGHPCPECGTARAADSTPACDCAERAGEALRETRLAEAAAAEDFDPLRIRPYVELGSQEGERAAEATMSLRPVPPAPAAPEQAPDPEPPKGPPEAEFRDDKEDSKEDDDKPDGWRRRSILIAAGGAVVATITAIVFAGGLFAYEAPIRDTSPPDDIRAAVPAPTRTFPTPSTSAEERSGTLPRTTPTPAAPPATAPPAPALTPSSVASATPSASPTPSTAPATGSVESQRQNSTSTATPVLRRGDTGTAVQELQLRLEQLYLYEGEADGTFSEAVENAVKNFQWSRKVTEDELGVYGAATREKLESETTKPEAVQ